MISEAIKQMSLVTAVLMSIAAFSAQELPFSQNYEQELRQLYFDGEKPSPSKIEKKMAEVRERREAVVDVVYMDYIRKGRDAKDAQERTLKNDNVEPYEFVLGMLEQLKKEAAYTPALALASQIADLDQALLIRGRRPVSKGIVGSFRSVFKDWKVETGTPVEREALNLADPKTGRFYSTQELAQLAGKGVDLSALNPPKNSTFWQDPGDIAAIDIEKNYYGGGTPLQKGSELEFPPNAEAKFDSLRLTSTKPKMNIEAEDSKGKEQEYKLKVGGEIHSDPMVNALLSATGFSTDVSKPYDRVKVYFPKKANIDLIKAEWNSHFDREARRMNDYDINNFIAERGVDPKKGPYLVFHNTLLEIRPKKLIRVGPWSPVVEPHFSQREARALDMFHIWISNTDIKPDNNETLIKKSKDGSHQIHHIPHDLGSSLGWNNFEEMPNQFGWDLVGVKKPAWYKPFGPKNKQIKFEFSTFHAPTLKDFMTYNDAKWMVRLIAQLTRDQITAAARLAKWPSAGLGQNYVEMLIERRDQLVKAFDLVGEKLPNGREITVIGADRNFSSEDGTVKNGKLVVQYFPGNPQSYGGYNDKVVKPVLAMIENVGLKTLQSVITGASRFAVEPIEIGPNSPFTGQVLITIGRKVQRNLYPTGSDDIFIVEDIFGIGGRLGAKAIVGADATTYAQWNVTYGVAHEDDARLAQGSPIDLLLGAKIFSRTLPKYLPSSYTIMNTLQLDTRVQIDPFNEMVTPVGGDLSTGVVNTLYRSLVSKRGEKGPVVYYRDQAFNVQSKARGYFQIPLIFEMPFYKAQRDDFGMIWNGQLKEISPSKIDQTGMLTGIKDAMMGEFRKLDDSATHLLVEGEFHSPIKQSTRLLWLYASDSHKYFQRLHYDFLKGKNPFGDMASVDEIQYIANKQKTDFNLFGTEELQDVQVAYASRADESKDVNGQHLLNTVVRLHLTKDDLDTSDKEMKEYLNFLREVADDQNMIKLKKPELFASNGYWGNRNINADIYYSSDAVDLIVNLDKQTLFSELAETLGTTLEELQRLEEVGITDHHDLSLEERRIRNMTKTASRFAKRIAEARAEEDMDQRAKKIVDALYQSYRNKGEHLDGRLLGTLHRYILEKNPEAMYMYAENMPQLGHHQAGIAGTRTFWGQIGKQKDEYKQLYFNLAPFTPNDLYHVFDWMYEDASARKRMYRWTDLQ